MEKLTTFDFLMLLVVFALIGGCIGYLFGYKKAKRW